MRRLVLVISTLALLVAMASVAYGEVRFIERQANQPQVAGDASSNTTARFPTNKQNEPSIAVNPVDARFLVAGANDEQLQPPCGPGPVRGANAPANDCSFFPGVGTSGVYTSSDGGSTWTNRGLLPGYSEFPGQPGSLVSDGDPRLAYGPAPDANGSFASARAAHAFVNGTRVYYASLASFTSEAAQGNQAPELLGVSTSDNNGITWSGPFVGAGGHGFRFNDHEDVTADKNPSSPFFGRAYLSWTEFRGSVFTFCAEPVVVAFSDDGGRTWSARDQLTAAHNCGIGGRQSSTVRAAPDGTVYVVWTDTSNKAGVVTSVAVSRDGGNSWSHPSIVAPFTPIADPIPGANFRTGSDPSVAVAPSGDVYVAFSDAAGGTGRITVYRSTDRAASWTKVFTSSASDGYAFFQGLDVAPNGRIDLAYQALKARNTATYGTGNAAIDAYYASSTNGTTWSASTKVTTASSDPAASAQNNLARQFWGDYNTLVSTNTYAYFIYTDSRNGAGCAAVDAYQHGVDGSGPATAKPAPQNVCPSQFGNTDAFVSRIRP